MNLEIANKLIELRKQHGYSQEKLAEKINISRQAISKWETGESSPDTDNLIALAKLYNISLDELLLDKKIEKDNKEVEIEIVKHNKHSKRGVINTCYAVTPIIIAFAYVIIGGLWNLWHPGWILFLLVPVIPSLFEAIIYKKLSKFNFPVFITAVYLFIGCEYGAWHPWWALFMLVPVFYLFDK